MEKRGETLALSLKWGHGDWKLDSHNALRSNNHDCHIIESVIIALHWKWNKKKDLVWRNSKSKTCKKGSCWRWCWCLLGLGKSCIEKWGVKCHSQVSVWWGLAGPTILRCSFVSPKSGWRKWGEKEGLRWKFTYLPLSYPNICFFFFFQCNMKSPIVLSKVLLDSHHSLFSTRTFQSMHLT